MLRDKLQTLCEVMILSVVPKYNEEKETKNTFVV